MRPIRHIGERHPMALLLRALGGDGMVTPWYTIYIRASGRRHGRAGLRGLLRHEICHIRQMQRDGWLTFWSRYCWWTITKGYAGNPYEIEAYAGRRQVSPSAALSRQPR
jgi:hypothetical protein